MVVVFLWGYSDFIRRAYLADSMAPVYRVLFYSQVSLQVGFMDCWDTLCHFIPLKTL